MKVKGPGVLRRRAAFAARLLGVEVEELEISWNSGNSRCHNAGDGKFVIYIQGNLKPKRFKYLWMEHVGHEMVHLRQFATGRLQYCPSGQFMWDEKRHPEFADNSDEYWLAPWELEARSLEQYINHKWETRDRELQ